LQDLANNIEASKATVVDAYCSVLGEIVVQRCFDHVAGHGRAPAFSEDTATLVFDAKNFAEASHRNF